MAVIAVENKFEYRAFISQPRENNFENLSFILGIRTLFSCHPLYTLLWILGC